MFNEIIADCSMENRKKTVGVFMIVIVLNFFFLYLEHNKYKSVK